jgi:hypothetical protein
MVNTAVVCGSELWVMAEMDVKAEYMGEENITEDIQTGGRAKDVENKK